MNPRVLTVFVLTLFASMLSGCGREPESQGPQYGTKPPVSGAPVYHFAIHPLHNPAKLAQAYQPLIDYLNSCIQGVSFELEASRDYANFEAKYAVRKTEFILPNPWQTLQAIKQGYHVIVMSGDAQDFKGIILVRKDSGIKLPADLKGKAVSYPSPTALAACVMPQYFLFQHGVDINKDIENRYVGSQSSAIMNVYLRNTAAGATWPPPWRAFQKEHPQEATELQVIWETESLINLSVMARDDVPADIRDQVRSLLVGLHETAEGHAILDGMETSRFYPATDKDYDVVKDYVARFERDVKPVDLK
ncbi:phosphate/phosphite/phosphonate ABC transporter substrate-binding protein [Candidatus Methylospira mobilis]|uniref:Phosphate/phosphite/phosphonate ABC transporter substrate-binding protein n=1 Tax=Candidatus Methylospira mobilis TaxID=1808979 RepID=A0A5Q0BGG6_9GAMM|nr:phosphate/phosphite/phosphonate ABC transporter substrate-binding protein [Candidatus Methylospira mobilis]QFY42629.1 phosphate/phosphite/phosphonate ABC transporter substrate-binding protein [Candidatus Methylospira mobilis]